MRFSLLIWLLRTAGKIKAEDEMHEIAKRCDFLHFAVNKEKSFAAFQLENALAVPLLNRGNNNNNKDEDEFLQTLNLMLLV